MTDYISREDVLNLPQSITRNFVGEVVERSIDVEYVKAIPAADVVPVVHGKWIPHSEKSREYIGTVLVHVEYDYWLCDTCGYRVEKGQPMYNFCPNCGAKMDGGDEHEAD